VPLDTTAATVPLNLGFRLIAAGLTVAGGIVVAVAIQSHWPANHLVFLLFALLAPAAAIFRLLPSVPPAPALLVAVAGAAALNGLIAQAMLAAVVWSRPGGIVAVGVCAALIWMVPTPARQTAESSDSGDGSLVTTGGRHSVPRVAVLGSGPYGLSTAMQLRAHGVPFRIFGTRNDDVVSEGVEKRRVVSLDRLGDGFELELDDGDLLRADFVVGAFDIPRFDSTPTELEHLPASVMSDGAVRGDLSRFSGCHVTIIGGVASAVEIATLLHEAGAKASLVARRPLQFAPESTVGHRSRWQWLYQRLPHLFRYLPGRARLRLIRRVLGPQAPSTMRARLEAGVAVAVSESIEHAREEDGRVRLVLRGQNGTTRETVTDHVIVVTAHYPKLSSVDVFSERLRSSIRTHAQMPTVSTKFESSVSGLYFVGPLALNSFGPLLRFAAGADYAAPRVARELARRTRQHEPVTSLRAAFVGPTTKEGVK
jgi:thioredoxin reductase